MRLEHLLFRVTSYFGVSCLLTSQLLSILLIIENSSMVERLFYREGLRFDSVLFTIPTLGKVH